MTMLDDLYNRMTEPSAAVAADLAQLDGDILVLGGGGKIGATLAIMAKRALRSAGKPRRVIVASRFDYPDTRSRMDEAGVETIDVDLFDREALARLPQAANVILMAGRKFGTSGNLALTWMINVVLPTRVAEAFPQSRILTFSTGNVYGYRRIGGGGALESESLAPVGEYAQTCVGRERVLSAYSHTNGTPMLFLRLNYAIDMQYGVLHDIAASIMARQPVDLSAGCFNCIWQGDAAAYALRLLGHCGSPPAIYNVTGPEAVPVRWAAEALGRRLGIEPVFTGQEPENALIANAAQTFQLLGYPSVTLGQMLDWTAQWQLDQGPAISAPTHFEERSGNF